MAAPWQRGAAPGALLARTRWGQEQPGITLGGSMFGAATQMGDEIGPLIGQARGLRETPIFHDPLLPGRFRQTPLTVLIGQSGSGKSTLLYLLSWFASLMGAAVLLVDPKGESTGLQGLPGVGPVKVIRLDAGAKAGSLDPFLIAPDPRQARQLAIDLVQQLVGPDLWRSGSEAVLAALDAVKVHPNWRHMQGVM